MLLGELRKYQHSYERTRVLDNHIDSSPHQPFPCDLTRRNVLRFEDFGGYIAHELRTKESDPPEPNNTGQAEQHSEQGVSAPARVFKHRGIGAKGYPSLPALLACFHPFFRFLESNLDKDAKERGQGSNHEHIPPGTSWRYHASFKMADVHSDQARSHVADG